ncbi:mannitol dehydrogenase family protein [Aldersonia sp. NBC_00410]|uniref:mannitol dehydrogenase family protein n=1 Tax=Aldersonia sp. NBC_00410 TaxID=2975954 RepID=UPI002257E551|nr:mannitol dehydrogenase family protein [Aldersonia sp. NBC_00410]MCX5041629.1 mannitol dehydrogenase family protein [Aldersonia sp. NBC_00410]
MTTAQQPVGLNSTTLAGLDGAVSIPSYDRALISTGIVHFGVGGFHRAHQAMYLDRLLERGEAFEWGICGVGVLPGDARMRDVMRAQDCLYTLSETAADGTWRTRVIGSIVEYLYAPDDPEAVIEKMANEQTRIVSLTITEGGYNFDAATGEFDAQNPAIVADLAPGAIPSTTFGLVVEALARRRARGGTPFTVMSCDNIQSNGHVARDTFTAFARLRDAELGDWIEREVAFPNSMVDRITPATTPDTGEQVRQRYSIEDSWPVATEPFTQWVLEDRFTAGRPPLEKVDVQVVDDVEPYELMKLRLLNASHQAMCYFGYLAGYRLVHEVAQDPAFAQFLTRYMTREGQPTLLPVPGVDLAAYERTLLERFSNPAIRDTVARLCAESSDRIPKWLLPVVRNQLAHDGEIECAAAVVASWARYTEGTDEQGEPIDVVDPLRETLVPIARRQREDPTAFIANRKVFGDLVDEPRFVTAYLWALESLHNSGARATVQALAKG